MKAQAKNTNILKDFFDMSHWETLVIVLSLVISFVGIWYLIKRFKLKFQYRVLIGLGLGLVYGLAISGGAHFPGKDEIKHNEWLSQTSHWFGLISSVFISGLMIMIIPMIFLAMARIFARQNKTSMMGVTWKGIAILLTNVAIAFTVTFWFGQIFRTGEGLTLNPDSSVAKDPVKTLPNIIAGYMPDNFFQVLGTVVVIPALVLGAIVGFAVKKSSKRHPEQMESVRRAFDTSWTIIMSVLMFVIKFMPYAVLTMISKAIFSRPIGEFKAIGELIGLGYFGIIVIYIWHAFTVWLFGINVKSFIKEGFKPVTNGFLTQSSMATLPVAMSTLKNDMKMGEGASAPNIIMPLSTTMGLCGCAGVQSGVILTFLYNAKDATTGNSIVSMSLFSFFLVGLIVTMFTSLGIAGVPGTATIVTIGVVSTVGYATFVTPMISMISPLNGIFDMGRTAANVNGGLQASMIAGQLSGEVPEEMQGKGPLGPMVRRWNKKRAEKNAKKTK